MNASNPQGSGDLRTSAPFWVLLGGTTSGVLLFVIYVAVTTNSEFWLPAFVSSLIVLTIFTWLYLTQIKITKTSIYYRSLFAKKEIPLSNVLKADFVVGFHPYEPYQRFIITVSDGSAPRDDVLNASLFSPAKSKAFLKTLKKHIEATS